MAIRYVATSIAAGKVGTSSGTSSRTCTDWSIGAPGKLISSLPQGPTSPSSSSAGGRRLSTSRRTSANAARVSRRRVVSSRCDCSGSSSMVLAAASAAKAIPVRVGPSPRATPGATVAAPPPGLR